MELVQMVGTALALGAAAGLKDTAAQTVKDAYAALRDYLQREVPAVASSIQQLEKDPHLNTAKGGRGGGSGARGSRSSRRAGREGKGAARVHREACAGGN